MIDRVDRILVAVKDVERAAGTFETLLGAEVRYESASAYLGARRLTLALGESEVELLEPAGDGPVGAFMEERGEGLFAVGFATDCLEAIEKRLASKGVKWIGEEGALHLAPEVTRGMRAVIRPLERREGPDPVSHIYEVTKMTADWRAEADFLTDLFGLDPDRFSPITSEAFGYTGSLLLFNPPQRLDRVELSQVTDAASAMGRFVGRRGETLYMCFIETDRPAEIVERLEKAEARWAATPGDHDNEHFFIHPSSLHGVLMGVSRTNIAWLWSGRPDLAGKSLGSGL